MLAVPNELNAARSLPHYLTYHTCTSRSSVSGERFVWLSMSVCRLSLEVDDLHDGVVVT